MYVALKLKLLRNEEAPLDGIYVYIYLFNFYKKKTGHQ